MDSFVVSTFYKYIRISDVPRLRKSQQSFCDRLGIKGKILVADEGINGAISGTPLQVEKYKKWIHKDDLFRDVAFKDTPSPEHPYKKMIVRIRPEIVAFGAPVDLRHTSDHVSPSTLKQWIENEQVVLIDARNDYESRIGKFKNAIIPGIKTFREFPEYVKKLSPYKDKKIVTYCTGGIRCEKASAYLKEQGFKDVYQLEDGIINFVQQFPDSYFEGRCFVFDSRLSVPSGDKNNAITACDLCHVSCDSYINCRNVKCDSLFVCCSECSSKMGGTCSKKCKNLVSSA